ncbi:MAG: hypothetical protein IV100_29950 [Myxococcales bacterium]|nr:hypothetical protein [Myxococcales bacterium]
MIPLLSPWLALTLSCGAGDDDATPFESESRPCTRIEALVPTLVEIADGGGLPALSSALQDTLTRDLRQGLVDAVLGLVKDLPAGTLTGLWELDDRGALDAIVNPITGLLIAVEIIATENPPAQSPWQALGVFSQVLTECRGEPLLRAFRDLLGRPAFRAQVDVLLAAGLDVDALLLDLGVDVQALEGRAGFQALFTSLLRAVAAPDFTIAELTGDGGLLRALVDPNDAVITATLDLMNQLLTGDSLVAVQGLSSCLLELDTERRIAGLLLDLLRKDALETLAGLGKALSVADANFAIDHLALPILDGLIERPAGRAALADSLAALLRPEIAPAVMAEVLLLLERGVVTEVALLARALTTDACP